MGEDSSLQLTSIDRHFADFICRQAGCSDRINWWLAALLSSVVGEGHSCLDLDSAFCMMPEELIAGKTAGDCADLLLSLPTVGRPGSYTPLLLDNRNRLYLYRYWQYEHVVLETVKSMLAMPKPALNLELLSDGICRMFPYVDSEEVDWQRVAAAAAMINRFTIISGGPGTGKTSTVVKVLALMLEQAGESGLRIALTAPTGKAAARLGESISSAKGELDTTAEITESIPDKVTTIHRLLGPIHGSVRFRHNKQAPLPFDLVVVDEASMISLPLMAKLLDALPVECRLILLGDRDQLASVDAGAVLGDMCDTGGIHTFSETMAQRITELSGECIKERCPDETANPLADSIVMLQRSYRFDDLSVIGMASRMVNKGMGVDALKLMQSSPDPECSFLSLPSPDDFQTMLASVVESFYIPCLHASDPAQALGLLSRFRILSPMRSGPFGVDNLNRLVEKRVRTDGEITLKGRWYSGQPIMVTSNDPNLGLFNGDVGIIWSDEASGALRAYFPSPEGKVRAVLINRLPEHETVYAMTVHKSQGSEFDRLLLILPDRDNQVLTRELIYTALTRARRGVKIWGCEDLFVEAVHRRVERKSGLRPGFWE